VIWHRADLFDVASMQEAVATADARILVHLAWTATPGKFWTDTSNTQWVQASTALAECFIANGGRGILASGSCAEYIWDESICEEETTALAPATLYGASKHALRLALAEISRDACVPMTWVRLFNMFGPNEHRNRVIASCIISQLKGEDFDCTDGKQRRDFLDVRDAADVIGLLARDLRSRSEAADSSKFRAGLLETYNVASGCAVRLRDLLTLIERSIAGPGRVRYGAKTTPANEPERLVASIERLQAKTGWAPRHDLESGIHHALEWWDNQCTTRTHPIQTKVSK
jgi:nucleoside-diphosphate-sugar epimerase